MRKCITALFQCLTLVAVLCFCVAHSAQADNTYSVTTTVYYVDSNTANNPYGLTSTGDSISTFDGGITSSGGVETITFDAVTSADVNSTAAVSVETGPVTMQLYGYGNAFPGSGSLGTDPPATPLVNSLGQLNPGTYTFSSCPGAAPGGVTGNAYGDYFGINDYNSGTQSAQDCGTSNVPCLPNSAGPAYDQLCLMGDSPTDMVTINVSSNGIVTVTAGSFEVAFSEVPELSSLALFGTGLLAMGIFFRKKGFDAI